MKKCFLLAMLALLMFSCGEKAKTLRPVASKIDGDLTGCFEVVVRDYKIFENKVNVEFVRVNEGLLGSQIVAEFLDDNDNVVAVFTVGANQNEMRFLQANKVGESSTISFVIGGGNPTKVRFSSSLPDEETEEIDEETWVDEDFFDQSADTIDWEEGEEDTEEEETETDEGLLDIIENAVDIIEDASQLQSTQSHNSKDWDKVLDDYESYVDHYISLLKKANNGDLSAMTEYVKIMEKAEELEKDLNDAENEMSNAQMKRYMKITKKMTDAAYEMYDKVY